MTKNRNVLLLVGVALLVAGGLASRDFLGIRAGLEQALRHGLGSTDKLDVRHCKGDGSVFDRSPDGHCLFYWNGPVEALLDLGRLESIAVDPGAWRPDCLETLGLAGPDDTVVLARPTRPGEGSLVLREVMVRPLADGRYLGCARLGPRA